jgi:hypothetical protein
MLEQIEYCYIIFRIKAFGTMSQLLMLVILSRIALLEVIESSRSSGGR